MEYYSNLELTNPVNRGFIEVVYNQVYELFKTPLLFHYTDHSVQHSLRVEECISKLLEGLNWELSEDEKIILLSAILLHDIGMQTTKYTPNYDPEKPRDFFLLESIRENHHEYSYKLILESVAFSQGDKYYLGLEAKRDLVDFIATVAKHHRKCDIDLLTEPINAGRLVRVKLLSALLRLGDCLDLDYRRVNIENLLVAGIPVKSQLFWYCHHYVQGIDILSQKIIVYFRFPESYQPDSGYQQVVIDYIKKEIIEQMDEVYNILDNYGIRLHKNIEIHIDYSPTLRGMDNSLEDYIKLLSMKTSSKHNEHRSESDENNIKSFSLHDDNVLPNEKNSESVKMEEDSVIMNGFRWIQLSDLHLYGKSFDAASVRRHLIDFFKERQLECDYVFITGDIAHLGEYNNAVDFVKELLGAISIPNKANILWCVGNHDIKHGSIYRNRIIRDIRESDDTYASFETVINDEETRSILLETCMKNYIDAHKNILERSFSESEISKTCSYYDLGKCNVVLFNTCITSCDDQDDGQLILNIDQLQEALNKVKDKSKPLIAIGHHGFKCIYEDWDQERSLIKMFNDAGVDLYLCGHSNKTGYDCFNRSGYSVNQVVSGIGETDNDSETFSVIVGEYNDDKKIVNITTYSHSENSKRSYVDAGSHFYVKETLSIELPRMKKQQSGKIDIFYETINRYHENNSRVKFIREMTEINNRNKQVFLTKLKMDDAEVPITFLDAVYKLDHDEDINPLFIYGDGGSGKTFMLIKGLYDIQESSGRHVLYVPLNNLSFETNRGDEKAIENYLQTRIFNGANLDWKQYYAGMNGEELLMLLDGFNEIAVTGNRREAIANEIEGFSDWLNCKIVIASRYENVLASRIRFGKKAKITELTDDDVKNYLRIVKPKLSQRLAPALFDLLKNPLMLNLYGQTTLTQDHRGDGYNRDCKLCKWIEFDNLKDIRPTHVLWNYLNREIFKAENLEEKFLAWSSVHIFWPRVAFRIQSSDTFDISANDLDIQIKEGLAWVKDNINSHHELKHVVEMSNNDEFDFDFEEYMKALDYKTIRHYMRIKQAFFAEQTDIEKQKSGVGQDSYTFLHQSIRDCLASMHLINVAPTENELFPIEWAKKDIFRNNYIFDHVMNLAEMLNDFSVIKNSIEFLRGHYIPEDSYLLDNLLFTYRHPELGKGNLASFDFSQLDLYNCDLTEMILNNGDVEANLSEAKRIGDNTFIKPSHNKTVQCIALSKDGKMVLSCGDDKVLLWKFNERKVDKVIHRYNIGATNNKCCFSMDAQKVLYTDENLLMVYCLRDNKVQRHLRTNGKIIFLSSGSENEIEYIFAKDEFGINYCWSYRQDNNNSPEYVIYPHNESWIHHTHRFGLLLRYQSDSPYIELINHNSHVIHRYLFSDLSHPTAVSFAKDANLCAISYKMSDEVNKVVILDLARPSQTSYILTDINVYCIAFASSGRWFSIIGYLGGSTSSLQNYQRRGGVFEYTLLCKDESEKMKMARFSSLTIYESIIYYGAFNGKIVVDEIARSDPRYYGYTTLDNHPPYVTSISIIPGIGRCIASYEDGVLREWDYKNGLLLRTHERMHESSVNCVAVANEKKLFVSGGADGRVLLWDREESNSFLRVIGDISSNYPYEWDIYPYRINSVAFAGNDRYVVAGTVKGDIFVWDIEDGNFKANDEALEPMIVFEKYKNSISVSVYNTDNQERLLVKTIDGDLSFGRINYEENKIIELVKYGNLHGNRIQSSAFSDKSPFGKCVVTYGNDCTIKLWDAKTGNFIKDLISTIDYGAVCFSPNGNTLYYSYRGAVTYIMEIDLTSDEPLPKEFHSIHAVGSSTRICTYENDVLTSARDGFIQVCDSAGNPLHRLEVPRTNISEFKSFKVVSAYFVFMTPEQFFEINEVLIGGKFQEWLEIGEIVNIFPLIRMSKERLNSQPLMTLFGTELLDCVNEIERIRVLARAIITCTLKRCPSILPGEYELLESLLIYVDSEGSFGEKNVFTIVELLSGEKNGDLPLTAVFNTVIRYNRSHRALRGFRSFHNNSIEDKKAIIDSLLMRLQPMVRIYSETLPSIPFKDIHALSTSMVMNFNIGWCCPDNFDQTANAQVLFLEILWHYMNQLMHKERTRKKLFDMLNKNILDSLNIFRKSFNNPDLSHTKSIFEAFEKVITEENYPRLESANRLILNFYREV